MEITREEYLKALDIVEAYHNQIKKESYQPNAKEQKTIMDLRLSNRALNAIRLNIENAERYYSRGKFHIPLSEIGALTLEKLYKTRQIGGKTVDEIKNSLAKEGIIIPKY